MRDPDQRAARTGGGGLLPGGCCAEAQDPNVRLLGRRPRRLRVVAGGGLLVLAGAIASRELPGKVALWPAALVPTWFGISHLVAGVTGYPGCPEIGAIPSVMLGRPVATGCEAWEWIDERAEGGTIR
jgi:hypothetical protein